MSSRISANSAVHESWDLVSNIICACALSSVLPFSISNSFNNSMDRFENEQHKKKRAWLLETSFIAVAKYCTLWARAAKDCIYEL